MQVKYKLLALVLWLPLWMLAGGYGVNIDVKIKGNVKRIEAIILNTSDNNDSTVNQRFETYDFNSKQQLLHFTSRKKDLQEEERNEYNAQGLIQLQQVLMLDGGRFTNYYTYNVNGQLSEIRNVSSNGKTSFTSFTYDSIDRIIECLRTRNGIAFRKSIYNYENGKTESISDSFGVLIEQQKYVNDTSDNVQLRCYYNSDSSIKRIWINVFDGFGRITSRTVLEDNKVVSQTLYEYDGNGNITLLKLIDKNKLSHISNYDYEYDDMGNWTKRTIYDDGKCSQIEKRTITY